MHVTAITLADAKFVVRPAGREKVRREGKKNVHAFAVGDVSLRNGLATSSGRRVTYNPYVNDTFVFVDTGEPVTDAHVISMWTDIDGKPSSKRPIMGHFPTNQHKGDIIMATFNIETTIASGSYHKRSTGMTGQVLASAEIEAKLARVESLYREVYGSNMGRYKFYRLVLAGT